MQKQINTEKIDDILLDIIQNVILEKYIDNSIEIESIVINYEKLINECIDNTIREKEENIIIRLNYLLNRIYGDNIPNTYFEDDEYFPNKVFELRNTNINNIKDIYNIVNESEF